MIRPLLHLLSYPIIAVLLPVKLLAWWGPVQWLRRLIIACTAPVDFVLIWLDIQNETMLLHGRVYGGNFIFGRGLMVTDYATTAAAIARPGFRGNNFMGVSIVASDAGAFATNAPILNQCPPIRRATRDYLDRHINTGAVCAHGRARIRAMRSSRIRRNRSASSIATGCCGEGALLAGRCRRPFIRQDVWSRRTKASVRTTNRAASTSLA